MNIERKYNPKLLRKHPLYHLMPERKKNMGMFQAFMLMMNHSAARCHSGTLVAQPSLLGSVSGMILT